MEQVTAGISKKDMDTHLKDFAKPEGSLVRKTAFQSLSDQYLTH